MQLSRYAICGSTKSRFIKGQEPSGLMSSLAIKAPLSKTPLLGNVFFNYFDWIVFVTILI